MDEDYHTVEVFPAIQAQGVWLKAQGPTYNFPGLIWFFLGPTPYAIRPIYVPGRSDRRQHSRWHFNPPEADKG